MHGPTSILCSQVLPFSCAQCNPEPGDFSSVASASSSHQAPSVVQPDATRDGTPSSAQQSHVAGEPTSSPQSIENHPYFVKSPQQASRAEAEQWNRFGGADQDTCASCRISLPEGVSKKLSGDGARDGGKASSPVLRSREKVYSCGGSHSDSDDDTDAHFHPSLPDSLQSVSTASDGSCHAHILTYLSLRGPPKPADYALLRRSSIRTLSCELLPRGLSSGPLCFGDPVTGYTIAYVFRLPDPMARGKRRNYALIALAGRDAGRAFRASPTIWRAFARIAGGIVASAEKHQEEEKRREEQAANRAGGRDYTPVSSFLTGRAVDPDGMPRRRAGQIRARNLAEIVGNEYIFAELHAQFVALLQQLGNMFGGVPIAEDRFVCSTVGEEGSTDPSRRGSLASPLEDRFAERQSRRLSDLGLGNLNISSSGPQPIPISQRRPIAA